MFDWSRGELLKAMQRAKVPHATYDPMLKGFAYAWIQSVVGFDAGAKVLDVGCGASPYYIDDLRRQYGIEAHGMDKMAAAKNVREVYRVTPEGETKPETLSWGLNEETTSRFPEITLHDAFAGEGKGPDGFFDAVISVSTLEHTYDEMRPVSRGKMYPHYDALRDMARMVKPGGILAFTYDFLFCYPFNPGWSPAADHEYLTLLGLLPCHPRRGPVSETFIYNHVDSLFVQPDMVLSFSDRFYRIGIVCFAFFKPPDETGSYALVRYGPRAALRSLVEQGPFEYPIFGLAEGEAEAASGSGPSIQEQEDREGIVWRPRWAVSRRERWPESGIGAQREQGRVEDAAGASEMRSEAAPLLSVVLVGRNDDFGGDFNGRMFAAAEFNHRSLENAGIAHEYILVEWNPTPGRPYLATLVRDALPWWHRRYVVDPAWHGQLSVNPKVVFMEFFAKNVGIRRARGRFVLTTNTDIWLSRGVLRALPGLREKVLYRAMRVDLKREVGYDGMTHETLEHPESVLGTNVLAPEYYSNASGDFLLLDGQTYRELGGFNEVYRLSKIHKDSNFCVRAVRQRVPVEVIGEVFHLDHESSWNNMMRLPGTNLAESHVGPPDWDWESEYENPADWGLAGAVEVTMPDGSVYLEAP